MTRQEKTAVTAKRAESKPSCMPMARERETTVDEWEEGNPPAEKAHEGVNFPVLKYIKTIFKSWAATADIAAQASGKKERIKTHHLRFQSTCIFQKDVKEDLSSFFLRQNTM
jgi:hypothetical protein